MKRNNLIFYGIPNEAREKEHALIGKVTFLDEDRECKVKMTSCQSEYLIKRPEGFLKMKIVDLDNASRGKGVDPPEHENPEGGGDHHRKQDVRSLRLFVFISAQAGNNGCLSIMVCLIHLIETIIALKII